MKYLDFDLRARDVQNSHFSVEVTASSMDRMRAPEDVTLDEDVLTRLLRNLERGRISLANLILLGQELARLAFPPTVRTMLLSSFAALGAEEGLRLRLILDAPQLANLPWEFLYLDRVGIGEQGRDGFLALDPRISLVRHEAIPFAAAPIRGTLPLKLLVGFASPRDQEELDLNTERRIIETALDGVSQIQPTYLEHLTIDALQSQKGPYDIFHFAGHGRFGDGGSIVLEDARQRSMYLAADRLALTLRALGVRMAVLGACESGRRDGINVWNGVAPALAKVGIPAVVANQYPIVDETALTFTRRFYGALAAGLDLDQAMSAGRLAIVNAITGDTIEFGVPVLYLRGANGNLFPEASEDSTLEPARKQIQIEIQQRIEHLQGILRGAQAGAIRTGNVHVSQEIDHVDSSGSAIGVEANEMSGGALNVEQKATSVSENATVTGVQIENID
jgi:hypothetical protein